MASNLVRFDPFVELEALRRDLFDDGPIRRFRGGRIPATDVYTDGDDKLIVETHLGNFDEKDITVSIDKGALVIQAEHHEQEEDKKKKYVVRESSNSFYRSISLPEQADDAKIAADFSKGVLKVTVPLAPVASPKKIEIASKG